jgi:hypothetical protein
MIYLMQEARRKPARRHEKLGNVAVIPGQEWDGYIACGAMYVNSINTANRIIRNTMALIILFPVGNHLPSSRRQRGYCEGLVGGVAGVQHTFLRIYILTHCGNDYKVRRAGV